MKKEFYIFIIFISSICISNAQQVNEHAIGVRLGAGDLIGGEISYQMGMQNDLNRFEFDGGFGNGKGTSRFYGVVLYHWVFNLVNEFQWYIGPGVGLGFVGWDSSIYPKKTDGIFLNIVGQFGVEYTFDAPIEISIDYRPEIGIINSGDDDFDAGFGFSVRYVF